MDHVIHSIEMRKSRGKIVVQGMGRTSRGQKFLVKEIKLTTPHLASPNLKSEMRSAVSKLLEGQAGSDTS